MKKLALLAVMAGFLCMGATCGSVDISALAAQVQQATRQACAFVPTVETIAAIFAAGKLTQAAQIADAICAAVKPQAPTGNLTQVVTVSGVPIVGHFVRQ